MLAIAGGKGGSGKTTTTLGLASAIDGPAVAVDADRDMPNLHSLADVDREPTLASLGDRDVDALAQSVRGRDDVGVLPAPRAGERRNLDAHLSRLAAVETSASILVDCPAGAGPDAAAPLRLADGVVLATSLCAPALRDTAKTAAMARALGTSVHGAVMTRCRVVPDGVEGLLGCPVLAAVPPADPPVLSSDAVRRAYRRALDRVG
ncbi:MinD/ParA family protein [Haloplanus sp. GCM10025708]|uniref:MinD/ParA family ATP-binding protein n=1 Tax=Haloferacaceae TaxID=1644056 RepID=UPI0036169840